MDIERWAPRVRRVFGALHICFAVFGFWLIGETVSNLVRLSPQIEGAPFVRTASFALTILNIVFLAVLILAGVWLLRLKPSAVKLSNILFATELIYFFIMPNFWVILQLEPGRIARSIGAAGGVGNMGIGPQILTGYPLIALIVLNILPRKQKRSTSTEG